MTQEEKDKSELALKIEAAAGGLIEHCDGLIILASYQTGDSTSCLYTYRGNFHTALGLMEEFKLKKLTPWPSNLGNFQEGSEDSHAD